MICPTGEAKYFCNEDWTTQIYAQRPRWEIRSIQLGGGNGIGLRMLEQLQRGFKAGAQIGGGVRTAPQPCGRQESDFGRAIRLRNENAGSELYFDRAYIAP
jgi:hypothetical protein